MEFRRPVNPVRPRGKKYEVVGWKISQQVRALVEAYAEYAEVEPYQLVDEFLLRNLPSVEFIDWLDQRRFNKRWKDQIFPEGLAEAKRRVQEA